MEMVSSTLTELPRTNHLLNRFDLLKRLHAKLKRDEAVIGGIGNNNFDLWVAGRRPQNFYMLGSMGLAFPIALGVALAQPKRGVVAIEGDGSLLMQLGCLATIATIKPRNLLMIVMDNGGYQITGSQPSATSKGADLVAMARGAGIDHCHWADDETAFEALIDGALVRGGPTLIAAKIDMAPAEGATDRDPARIRDAFMRGIAAKA
jgi:thiamine pyrophosphate-dependent acetolactate synthase large subunit-like protein